MHLASAPGPRGVELRPIAARLVARHGAVLGIVAPASPQAATGWRVWTQATSGVAVSLHAALARIADDGTAR